MTVDARSVAVARAIEADNAAQVAWSEELKRWRFHRWISPPMPQNPDWYMPDEMNYGDLFGAEAAFDLHVRTMPRAIAPGDLGLA